MKDLCWLQDSALFCQAALIGSDWVAADDGRTMDVTDPATGAVIGKVPDVSAAQTRAAIDTANAAFQNWRKRPHAERAGLLERWFYLMNDHAEDLARILTAEQGSLCPKRAAR